MGKSKHCIRHLYGALQKVKDVKRRSVIVQGKAMREGITEGRTHRTGARMVEWFGMTSYLWGHYP